MPTRSLRHRAARARRRRRLLLGIVLSLAVAAGGAFYLRSGYRLDRYLAGPASAPTQTAAILPAARPCPAALGSAVATGTGTGNSSSPGTATFTSSPASASWPSDLLLTCPQTPALVSLTPSGQAAPRRSRPPARPSASPRPARTAGPSPAASPPPTVSAAVQQVLTLINQTRIQDELPPYTLTRALDRSAGAHTALMAGGCGLSHQCAGEPALGARETAAGVHWTAAGENIGEGGPEPATPAAIARMAVTLTQDMLNEQPPGDGHRRNLLSSTFHHIGIAIVRGSDGTVWMTQDFSS